MGRFGLTRVTDTPDDNSPTERNDRPSYAELVASLKRSSDRLIPIVAKGKAAK
jgi:hypothetical protein